MIVSFGDKTTENIFHGTGNKKTRKYTRDLLGVIVRKLDYINAAFDLADLKSPPGNRLEKLKSDLKEFHSIRVNDQYRLVFIWQGHDAGQVKITDYH